MVRDPTLLLFDVKRSAEAILKIAAGLTLADCSENVLARPAVERCFEVLGEALNRLCRADPVLAERVPGLHRAIAFRDILIHACGAVGDAMVWKAIEWNPPPPLSAVEALVAEREQP